MPTEQFEIKRAERKNARARLALCAASNGGKTWSALELGFGLVEELIARGLLSGTLEGKIGLIDTERRSAQLYAHLGPFDTIELAPPYSIERYVGAMQALERTGITVLIIDSISHAWVGNGGVLSLLARFENHERFSAFNTTVNPVQDEFVDAILRSPCHVIATMRSKTAWVLEQKENRNGRLVHTPKRVGMAPIQRPGIEYEFTTMFDLETDTHFARVVKNRCTVFDKWEPKRLTREHGRSLAGWLLEGAPEVKEPLSGTPLERAQATAAAAVRAVHRAENPADLQRIFTDGDKAIRTFVDSVDVAELAKLRLELAEAKDLRKKFLGIDPPDLSKPVIDAVLAAEVEAYAHTCGASLDQVRSEFGVARLSLLPQEKLQACCEWIHGIGIEEWGTAPVLPKRLADAGVRVGPPPAPAGSNRFSDMPDDPLLPWKD